MMIAVLLGFLFINCKKHKSRKLRVPRGETLENHYGSDKDFNLYGLPTVIPFDKLLVKSANGHYNTVKPMNTKDVSIDPCSQASRNYKFCGAYSSTSLIKGCQLCNMDSQCTWCHSKNRC